MRTPHLYLDQSLQPGQQVTLPDAAYQHLIKVLRMAPGQALRLFNGSGHFYPATLIEISKRHASVQIEGCESARTESCLHTHLGQVVSRGDRMDYAIQKSTELGVTEITPLLSERCEVKLNQAREDKRLAHWQQIAIHAAEQSGRSTVPRIHPVSTLSQWIQTQPETFLRLVLHHRDTEQLTQIQPPPRQVSLLIGPEGGLSESEIELARTAGFVATTLGPRIFRTETAPIAALSVVQWLWGDFQHSATGFEL